MPAPRLAERPHPHPDSPAEDYRLRTMGSIEGGRVSYFVGGVLIVEGRAQSAAGSDLAHGWAAIRTWPAGVVLVGRDDSRVTRTASPAPTSVLKHPWARPRHQPALKSA